MLFTFDLIPGFRRGKVRGEDRMALGFARIQALLPALREESDDQLRARAHGSRRRLGEPHSHAEAIALVAESVRRSHGLIAHAGQLEAGLALADGALVEMAGGEGKTLAALFPAFIAALRGRGVHVAAVNPCLAERGAEFAWPVFARLGMSVGLLREGTSPAAKRGAYSCDVTYGVASEFGLDSLRDQLALRASGRAEPHFHEILLRWLPPKPALLQRGQAFAIIDDVDTVLLDEARGPLVVATGERRPSATPEIYRLADAVAADLKPREHFTRDPHDHRLALTPAGERFAFTRLTGCALLELRRVWPRYLENALRVRHQLRRDVHFVVAENQVRIVDEFTGRVCPDRTWRDGLHQAAEARADVTITEENSAETSISHLAYFQLYERVCGLTSTATEATAELRTGYDLRTVVLPPHRRSERVALPDRIFTTRAAQLAAIVRDVTERHAAGQPILIGTRTIEHTEAVVEIFASLELPLRIANGKQDAAEAAILAQAGQFGAITIATKMAGRGAHIPVPEESQRVGGLHVIGLERHDSARLDRQLIGRAGRHGQPGSSQFFLSLEDDLIQRHTPTVATRLAIHTQAAEELPSKYAAYFLQAQRKAETLEHAQRRALAAHHRWLHGLQHAA